MIPILSFLIIYLFINYSFGITQFLINPMSMNFLGFNKEKSLVSNIKIFTRIIKFNADFAILSMIILLVQQMIPQTWSGIILFAACIFIFIYQVYYHTIKKLYNTQPNFMMDNKLIQLGFQVVYYGYKLYFFLGIILVGLIFCTYYFACQYFAKIMYDLPNPLTAIGILSIVPFGAIFLLSIKKRSMWGYPKMRFYFTAFMVYNNLKDSKNAYQLIHKFKNNSALKEQKIDHQLNLENKPNILFLFIESYGKILYEKYGVEFKIILEKLENKLAKSGFHTVTNLSNSPRSGGGSWICYSSFLYGLKVENEGLFRIILEKENASYFNASILEILQKNDYQNYLLNPLTGFSNLKINWEEIRDLFSAKEIIKYEDLEYKGKLIGSLGLQPPDQFSLNKGFEKLMNQKEKGAYSLFFETLNSHAKWQSPTEVEKDWKRYNDANYSFETTKMNNESYLPAIDYQINFLVDFIIDKMGDDDIIMLMGDHQPPLVTLPDSGNETPVHIISKNKSFLNHFKEYGFENGLWLDEREINNVTHPGMYYIMLRSLIKEFGKEGSPLPDYLHEGVILK